ncbi:MAG: hypothetical protein AAGB34_05315 [Planctomycetota bacterium]
MPKLAELNVFMRLGIALLVVVLLGGYVVSGLHMQWHYDSRDGIEGLTIDDIKGHYHGVQSPSPLIAALESGHPETLPGTDREALLDWLGSGSNLSERYDDLDLGDEAPAEIIAMSCLDCHSRGASGPDAYAELPLEYWDDIQPIAYATDIQPTTIEIVAMSQHTHAPTMAVVLIVLALLGVMTRANRFIMGSVVCIGAIGLLGDMASWWLARGNENWVYFIVAGGFLYGASTALVGLIVIVDCLIPAARSKPAS